ncbi:hypothetical protein [Streptomyces ossamyceticus]|uniref:hypothetical protein n=1 Tax=Streptomyces ossamyceticus TaxID=249581 RepID=UPI0006E145CF|nr:hypothetical protein [Streptomyces ossamyceticus]
MTEAPWPLDERDEVDGFAEVLAELWAQAYAEACAEAEREFDRRWITGSGTGEIRGLSATRINAPYSLSEAEAADHGYTVGLPEPTPVERALEILGPELKKIPGYIPTTDPEG